MVKKKGGHIPEQGKKKQVTMYKGLETTLLVSQLEAGKKKFLPNFTKNDAVSSFFRILAQTKVFLNLEYCPLRYDKKKNSEPN